MHQPEEKTILFPEVQQAWMREAEANEELADVWRDYALLMAAFQAALERAPHTSEACEGVDIERLLIAELEHLADIVNVVFPHGGMTEFASYVTGTQQANTPKEVKQTRQTPSTKGYKARLGAYQPRDVSVGQGRMVMTSEDFVNGYQAGHLSSILEARTITLTDEEIITRILGRLARKDDGERYNAGYIVGWIVALASKEKQGEFL